MIKSRDNSLYIGIVIPTYNERENIIELLKRISRVMSNHGYKYRVLVVDDNSPDKTADIVREYSLENKNVDLIVRPGKMGIGSAVLDGIKKLLENKMITHIVTMDADFSHQPEDLPKLLEHVYDADMVQGSRYVRGGEIIGWGFHRKLISRCANFLVKILYKTGLKDNTGNYRVYSRKVAVDLVKYSQTIGYEWVIEALLITIARGYHVVETPIKFIDRGRGTSKLGICDILKWFIFILRYKKRFRELLKTRE